MSLGFNFFLSLTQKYIIIIFIKNKDKERNMIKVFGVFHKFDVDGGFGDAITEEELICTFDTLEKAEEFKKKYEDPHIYECPYDDLECGELIVRELPSSYDESGFWWIRRDLAYDEEETEGKGEEENED